jgi:hypothetical protein
VDWNAGFLWFLITGVLGFWLLVVAYHSHNWERANIPDELLYVALPTISLLVGWLVAKFSR